MAPATVTIKSDEKYLERLFLFIDELRLAGFNIGAGDYIRVQELLFKLADEGKLPRRADELCSVLTPLLCHSAGEQKEFKTRFERWQHHFDLTPEEPPSQPQQPQAPEQVKRIDRELEAIQKKSRRWLISALAVVLFWFVDLVRK